MSLYINPVIFTTLTKDIKIVADDILRCCFLYYFSEKRRLGNPCESSASRQMLSATVVLSTLRVKYHKLNLSGLIQQTTSWWYMYFSYFSQQTGFDISWKLSPMETIFMKCHNPLSGKIRKKFNMISAENFTQYAKHKFTTESKINISSSNKMSFNAREWIFTLSIGIDSRLHTFRINQNSLTFQISLTISEPQILMNLARKIHWDQMS